MVVKRFMEACAFLGLMPLNPCRYALRHGGASRDLAVQARDLASIKKREGWRTDASLRRYAKETRLQAEIQKIPMSTVEFGVYIRDHLEAAFHRTLQITLPPSAPIFVLPANTAASTAGRRKRQRIA